MRPFLAGLLMPIGKVIVGSFETSSPKVIVETAIHNVWTRFWWSGRCKLWKALSESKLLWACLLDWRLTWIAVVERSCYSVWPNKCCQGILSRITKCQLFSALTIWFVGLRSLLTFNRPESTVKSQCDMHLGSDVGKIRRQKGTKQPPNYSRKFRRFQGQIRNAKVCDLRSCIRTISASLSFSLPVEARLVALRYRPRL